MRTTNKVLFAVVLSFLPLRMAALAADPPRLTEDMVRNVILTWYTGTNDHRPIEDLLALLSDTVEMQYPEPKEPFTGKDAFREWYANVLAKYFDETHKVESWDIRVEGQRATAVVVVRWERRWWKQGEARSHYEASLSRQRIELERSTADGRIVIRKKIVETFDKTAPVYDVGY